MSKNIAATRSIGTQTYNFKTFKAGLNTIASDETLSANTAKMCYNFEFKNGNLENGLGIKFLEIVNGNFGVDGDTTQFYRVNLPSTFHPVAAYHYRYYVNGKAENKIVIISKEKKVLLLNIPNYKNGSLENYELTLSVDEYPKSAVNYRLKGKDVLILTFENDNMHILDASAETDEDRLVRIVDAPKISSMCIHFERLFAIVAGEKNRVWFSSILDPTAWDISLDGAGYIEMIDERGALTKVVDFNGYVYVFREYGIARVSAYADQTEFAVTQLFTSSGRIYEETVAVCGDHIMFLAEDGLYSFDGSHTTHINMGIENLIDKSKYKYARSAYYNSKYYLACYLNYNDNDKVDTEKYSTKIINNSLITIDLNKSVLTVYRGFDIAFLNTINETDYSQLVCCHNGFREGMLGEIAEGEGQSYLWDLKKKWVSPKTTFAAPDKIKLLKKLEVKTSANVAVCIKSESQTKKFVVNASDAWQTIRLRLKGKEFEISFETDEQKIKICPPKLTFSVL